MKRLGRELLASHKTIAEWSLDPLSPFVPLVPWNRSVSSAKKMYKARERPAKIAAVMYHRC